MCSTDSQLMMLDAYESTYGILRHETVPKERPLALVAMNWSEDTVNGSSLFERMQQYHDCGILKFFGIPWDRWIEQPRYINEEQLRRGKLLGEAENGQVAVLQRQLNEMKLAAAAANQTRTRT